MRPNMLLGPLPMGATVGMRRGSIIAIVDCIRDYQQATTKARPIAEERQTPSSANCVPRDARRPATAGRA